MVEELLDFSRLTGGKIALRNTIVNLNDFANHIDAYMRPRANREMIIFNLDNKVGNLKY